MKPNEIRAKLAGIADKVIVQKTGRIIARRSYFYRHGMTEDLLAKEIATAIPKAKMISIEDYWRPWPRDSYFQVVFVLESK